MRGSFRQLLASLVSLMSKFYSFSSYLPLANFSLFQQVNIVHMLKLYPNDATIQTGKKTIVSEFYDELVRKKWCGCVGMDVEADVGAVGG